MKNEENQGFTSFDFITMIFSLAVIIAVSAPILKKKLQPDPNSRIAEQQASILGHELVSSKLLFSLADSRKPGEESRQIASADSKATIPDVDIKVLQAHLKAGESAGTIGKDPWGAPYNFVFVRNAKGMQTRVAVWSNGPNAKNETSVQGANAASVNFGGDDVGAIISVR